MLMRSDRLEPCMYRMCGTFGLNVLDPKKLYDCNATRNDRISTIEPIPPRNHAPSQEIYSAAPAAIGWLKRIL